jgi:hypothetical protein
VQGKGARQRGRWAGCVLVRQGSLVVRFVQAVVLGRGYAQNRRQCPRLAYGFESRQVTTIQFECA